MPELTPEQITAIRCAHADLMGALQAYEQSDLHVHDWRAHEQSIKDLESAFADLIPQLAEHAAQYAESEDEKEST